MKCIIQEYGNTVESGLENKLMNSEGECINNKLDKCLTKSATIHLEDMSTLGVEQKVSKGKVVCICFIIVFGFLYLLFNCLARPSIEITWGTFTYRSIQGFPIWVVYTVSVLMIIALVAIVVLLYWFELGMIRERRLLQKMKYDLVARQMDCCRDLVNGSPKENGTHRYEITIGPKTEKTQEQDLTPKA